MAEQAKYLKNLKSESVVQQVINCLTDGMVSGELKPGDRLPSEPELAAQLGVARTSVREATREMLVELGCAVGPWSDMVADRAMRTERPRIRLPWSREGDQR